jgi:hemerythrin-like metal-binding protein
MARLAAAPDNVAEARSLLARTEEAYGCFVPRQFLQLLGVSSIVDVTLGTHVERELTILFSDIRDFTTLSESMTAKENLAFINSYLSVMEPIIEAHGGVVDKFIGDAIMALFPGSADDAVACAVAMMARLESYNVGRTRAGYVPIRIGIGLNTGLVMLGTVGGRGRMDTTVIGDAVNLASRLETITKVYRAPLVIGEQTLYALKDPDRFALRFLDRLRVKGKHQAQSVYEVYEIDPPALRARKRGYQQRYEEALAYYHLENVARAQTLLESCVAEAPDDEAAATYLARCREYAETGRHVGTHELVVSLTWSDDFAIGHPVIDAQHRELVGHIDRLARSVRTQQTAEFKELLPFLGQYAQTHFRTEEELMAKYGYPFASEHIWQHKRFVEYYLHLNDEICSGRHDPQYLGFRIQLHLMDWFVTHSTGVDRHLVRFVNQTRARNAATP